MIQIQDQSADAVIPEYVKPGMQRMWVLLYLVNGKVVGVAPDPGELPYRVNGWWRAPGCRW